MKILQTVVFFVVIVLVQSAPTPEDDEKELKNFLQCTKELNVDFPSFDAGNPSEVMMNFLTDDKNKCIPKCLMEKDGLLDAAGNFDKEKAKTIGEPMSPEEEAKAEACVDKYAKVEDVCERYRDAFVCAVKALAIL